MNLYVINRLCIIFVKLTYKKWVQDIVLIQTGPGAHPVSCWMGTGSLSQGVKQQGHGIDHLPPSGVEVKERVEV